MKDMENKKRKRRKIDRKKKLILVLDGVLLVGLIVAAVVLATTLSARGGEPQSAAAAPAAPEEKPAASGLAAVFSPKKEESNNNSGGDAAQPATAQAAVTGDSADAMQIDFSGLSSEGVPAVAYLCSDNTPIQYPVVQHLDNEYYMARNSSGKKDENGAIFLDCRNSNEFLDEQIVIFGNPMQDGSMFGSLVSYQDSAYLTEHPLLYLYTPGGNYRIDVFAAHTASPAMANYPIWFSDAAARASYIEAAKAQSAIKPDVAIADEDKLVCLVTSSDFDSGANTRFVVHGVLKKA